MLKDSNPSAFLLIQTRERARSLDNPNFLITQHSLSSTWRRLERSTTQKAANFCGLGYSLGHHIPGGVNLWDRALSFHLPPLPSLLGSSIRLVGPQNHLRGAHTQFCTAVPRGTQPWKGSIPGRSRPLGRRDGCSREKETSQSASQNVLLLSFALGRGGMGRVLSS